MFEISSKEWRKGKIYSKKNNLFYYKTNSDSPFVLHRSKTPYPNSDIWMQCKYVDSKAVKCCEDALLTDDELNKFDVDHEIYTNVILCEKHKKFETSEIEKRHQVVDNAKRIRIEK